MATRNPISTISYNTEPFLREKLETWLRAHIIQAYQYIPHKGEDGDKNHIHVRIEPNKILDPMDLKEALQEYVIGSEKPLGCRPFRSSKEEDWILYVVHDKDYLRIKYGGGEKGEKIPYKWQEIRVPEDYDMECAYTRARSMLEHTSAHLIARLSKGERPTNLLFEGENPYIVNAVVRALNTTDYERVCVELQRSQDEISRLRVAIERANMMVVEDPDGFPQLVAISDLPSN